jgi:hypothetical protein
VRFMGNCFLNNIIVLAMFAKPFQIVLRIWGTMEVQPISSGDVLMLRKPVSVQ